MPNELSLEKSYEAILKAAQAKRFLSYSDIASANAVEWQAVMRQMPLHLKELLTLSFQNDWPMISLRLKR
jgi:hypothetical protein